MTFDEPQDLYGLLLGRGTLAATRLVGSFVRCFRALPRTRHEDASGWVKSATYYG